MTLESFRSWLEGYYEAHLENKHDDVADALLNVIEKLKKINHDISRCKCVDCYYTRVDLVPSPQISIPITSIEKYNKIMGIN